METILITGGTGFIGSNLVPLLKDKGYRVVVLSRTPNKYSHKPLFKDTLFINKLYHLDSADIVINLAGENLGHKRWSKSFKKIARQSRIETTSLLVSWMSQLATLPHTFISGSAIGFYGARGEQELTEASGAGNAQEFQVNLCRDWEDAALEAQRHKIRTCIIRTGVVLGKDGPLKQMLLPFKFGLGGKLGSGKQQFSWIHIDDQVYGIIHLIEQTKLSGVFNFTAPTPVTNKEFTKNLGKALKRPTFASMPAFALKIIMGEMAEILLTGQKVIPEKLLLSGYNFRFPELNNALEDIIN